MTTSQWQPIPGWYSEERRSGIVKHFDVVNLSETDTAALVNTTENKAHKVNFETGLGQNK